MPPLQSQICWQTQIVIAVIANQPGQSQICSATAVQTGAGTAANVPGATSGSWFVRLVSTPWREKQIGPPGTHAANGWTLSIRCRSKAECSWPTPVWLPPGFQLNS